MKKQPESGLVVAGTAKFGKMLLEEAVNQNQEDLKKHVIGTVQRKLTQIERQKALIASAQAALKYLEKQMKALEAGAFKMERSGAIHFSDEDLNREQEFTRSCQQCGYDKLVISRD